MLVLDFMSMYSHFAPILKLVLTTNYDKVHKNSKNRKLAKN